MLDTVHLTIRYDSDAGVFHVTTTDYLDGVDRVGSTSEDMVLSTLVGQGCKDLFDMALELRDQRDE